MRVPVPWVFVLGYLAGAATHRVLPIDLPARALPASHIAGALLMIAGGVLAAWCLTLFRAERTTTVPGKASAALVTRGPYQYTRNPMYVSLTLMYLGEAGLLAQVWPLLPLAFVLFYLQHTVIRVEEARLREVFGDTYRRYCAAVNRWM